ncbi:hypothetical protein D9V30_05180 [Mycetocola reblochoni]|uniref:Uncharacterized protein n=1 Tax=Mycetocola reblochoni TaxID=331618 RepID=A0A3L6ZQ60_9MICO|nr:hypothetical protein [Mycetocola reblochoni]RLP70060.1 hypothetical protein D9V30_05180 [Mycetocola reblochoni]
MSISRGWPTDKGPTADYADHGERPPGWMRSRFTIQRPGLEHPVYVFSRTDLRGKHLTHLAELRERGWNVTVRTRRHYLDIRIHAND